jgi:hypothetical protein
VLIVALVAYWLLSRLAASRLRAGSAPRG